jgi:hypothetical protein
MVMRLLASSSVTLSSQRTPVPALYPFTMPVRRSTKRAPKALPLPDDLGKRKRNQNRINQKNCRAGYVSPWALVTILNGARKKQAAKAAKVREVAGLTEPVRGTEQLEETVVERERSLQSEDSYSLSEHTSSISPEPDTLQRTGAKVQEMGNEVSMRC